MSNTDTTNTIFWVMLFLSGALALVAFVSLTRSIREYRLTRERRRSTTLITREGRMVNMHDGHVVDVNFEREFIPMNDTRDPTSLLLQLSAKHGAVLLSYDSERRQHVVSVEDHPTKFYGDTQHEALLNAKKQLDEKKT